VDNSANHELLGAQTQEMYNAAFLLEANRLKSDYIMISAMCETIKLVQSTASGGVPGFLVGLGFGAIGMFQAEQTGNEIAAGFEKATKWFKDEADFQWGLAIGSYREETRTVSRIAWPNPAIKDLPDPLPSGDYPRVDVQITVPVYLPHDGILGTQTQESPQERNWTGGSTPSGLNLEANKVDHFSQANHPTVRRQIEATIRGTTSNLRNVQDAFFVR
jgi:hypothetical protein